MTSHVHSLAEARDRRYGTPRVRQLIEHLKTMTPEELRELAGFVLLDGQDPGFARDLLDFAETADQ